ncbi:MAG: class I SAM-dependent methyltransferase [Elusimicrobia bacterium]|nr:class I SAM-dependent methyltransferase [Elusimicrobiota bacterium]
MKPVYKDSAKIFDQYASNYETCVNESLKLMGESVGYFASYKAGYLNRFFSRLGRYPDTILEIGCGIGVLTNALAEILPKHISIVGYDHSSQSIKTARSRAHPSNVCFVNSQDQLIKNPHGLVILANVLHHVPINEQESFLRQACQWTSRAGYIAIFEHNPWNPIILKIVRDAPA